MKAHTSMFELVLIMVFIVGCVPLLTSLVITCNRSKFNYLDDKTVYDTGGIVEYVYSSADGVYVPINLAPINLDFGGAQLIALIQDDNCPDQGKLVNWKLTANKPNGYNGSTYVPHLLPAGSPGAAHTLTITDGWYTKRTNAFRALHNGVNGSMISAGVNGPFYLVWDYSSDCWMITHEFVNIFEEK